MHLLGILIPEKAALLVNGDLLRENFTGRAAPIAEFLLDQRARTLRLHISSNGHHGILRAIMTRAECAKILRLVCRNALRGPQYRLPQRLRAKYGLRQHVVHHVLRRILHHGDFF